MEEPGNRADSAEFRRSSLGPSTITSQALAMSIDLMRQQWNEMASCNPFFSITSWPDFEDQNHLDINFFWKIGQIHSRNLLTYIKLNDLSKTSKLDMVEIGCGLGRMTHDFATRFNKVYALDISEKMIEGAKFHWGNLANVNFISSDGKSLKPISDKSVDFVLSFYVLNHVVQPSIVLSYIRETGRVLKPRGMALLHFRISGDYPLWNKPILQRIRLAFRNIKQKETSALWWNDGIERLTREYKTSLPSDFINFESWMGCEVPWKDVIQVTKESNLKIINTDSTLAANTQFVFVTLSKRLY